MQKYCRTIKGVFSKNVPTDVEELNQGLDRLSCKIKFYWKVCLVYQLLKEELLPFNNKVSLS